MRAEVLLGDARDVLASMDAASVDAIVTDPPAGIGFMGKKWDTPGALVERKADTAVAWDRVGGHHHPCNAADRGRTARSEGAKFRAALTPIFAECVRVLKPGHQALVWALPRTSHWTATALEDAGFYVADVITHHFGSGFPKSRSLLKPASEHWILCRAPGPLQPLQIDACRVSSAVLESERRTSKPGGGRGGMFMPDGDMPARERHNAAGRWPGNVLLSHVGGPDGCQRAGVRRVRGNGHHPATRGTGGLGTAGHSGQQGLIERHLNDEAMPAYVCVDGCPIKTLDEQAGPRTSGGTPFKRAGMGYHGATGQPEVNGNHGDTGGPSRFFPTFGPDPQDAVPFRYCSKASRREREAGLDDSVPTRSDYRPNDPDENSIRTRLHGSRAARNPHPCVKPLNLMSWLVRLIASPGAVVLDPFCGSGSTGVACVREGFGFLGIEQSAEYVDIARARIAYEQEQHAGPLFAGAAQG